MKEERRCPIHCERGSYPRRRLKIGQAADVDPSLISRSRMEAWHKN